MYLFLNNGYASRDELIKDAEILGLDKTLVEDFFDDISEEDVGEDDDIELTIVTFLPLYKSTNLFVSSSNSLYTIS